MRARSFVFYLDIRYGCFKNSPFYYFSQHKICIEYAYIRFCPYTGDYGSMKFYIPFVVIEPAYMHTLSYFFSKHCVNKIIK